MRSRRVVDLLVSLVDKSLLVYEPQPGGPGRYRLLETTRQYAREKLQQSGKEDAIRGRHLAFFLRLAEATDPHLAGPEQRTWLNRLEVDRDNLRTALDYSIKLG